MTSIPAVTVHTPTSLLGTWADSVFHLNADGAAVARVHFTGPGGASCWFSVAPGTIDAETVSYEIHDCDGDLRVAAETVARTLQRAAAEYRDTRSLMLVLTRAGWTPTGVDRPAPPTLPLRAAVRSEAAIGARVL